MNLIRALLVEDHEIARLGLRTLLEGIADISVIGEAADGKAAVSMVLELRPALVLMDIGLPLMDGIEATREIKSAVQAKVIIFTSHENDEDIFAALSAGADAYCLKTVSGKQLANAISSVMDNALWIDPGIARRVAQALARGSREKTEVTRSENCFRLSTRESEVLDLLVEGMSNQQMAQKLYLSTETVKTHMRHIMEKLQVSDRTQAAVKAVKLGHKPR